MNARGLSERIVDFAALEWEHPAAFEDGIDQVVLVDTLDEHAKRGIRTRIVRFDPGAGTRVPFLHDYHEEVHLIDGDQSLVDVATRGYRATYREGSYFVRPAGTPHGPFRSDAGCLLLEIHYYGSPEDTR
ncbi:MULTISPECIES: cupin [Burkholderia]|nr:MULTISPECIES: cupin [Burkholderia]MDP9547100.1 quercetin dioxygenase-like cupin family protein [Burkholderia cepacia]ELW9527449.1 cupin [Burkholderia cenocepacia]KWF21015.1 cupin [Burkholderia cenocepacia]MBN3503045.1 cupin [Burkholderia cenocepacia]MBR8349576.1 cupin [Burkholderia cenocepacia]